MCSGMYLVFAFALDYLHGDIICNNGMGQSISSQTENKLYKAILH